jgi:hypothetical protein
MTIYEAISILLIGRNETSLLVAPEKQAVEQRHVE